MADDVGRPAEAPDGTIPGQLRAWADAIESGRLETAAAAFLVLVQHDAGREPRVMRAGEQLGRLVDAGALLCAATSTARGAKG